MSGTRPRPVPDAGSAPYWEAAAHHVLALPRCSECRSYALPPGVVCSRCQSSAPAFHYEEVGGLGRVRSWTVLHDSFLPGFEELLPMVLVDVELDVQRDLRMVGRLVDRSQTGIRLGDRVRVVFEDLGPDVAIPAFVLDRPGTEDPQ